MRLNEIPVDKYMLFKYNTDNIINLHTSFEEICVDQALYDRSDL